MKKRKEKLEKADERVKRIYEKKFTSFKKKAYNVGIDYQNK